MAEKITHSHCVTAFEMLAAALGLSRDCWIKRARYGLDSEGKRYRISMNTPRAGAVNLDRARDYGGYRIQQMSKGGGEGDLLTSYRQPAREFHQSCHFALRALELANPKFHARRMAKHWAAVALREEARLWLQATKGKRVKDFPSLDDIPGDYCPMQGEWYACRVAGEPCKTRLNFCNLQETKALQPFPSVKAAVKAANY